MPAACAPVALSGDHAPGTPSGVNFSTTSAGPFGPAVLNGAGQIAFFARLTGSGVDSTNNTGIWSNRSGSLALVVRSGDQAPGTPSGVNYSSVNSPGLNDAGQIAFNGLLTGSGVDSTNDWGIWSEGSGSLALVAREGDHAPGTPSGVNYSNLFISPVLNDAGQTAFYAELTGSGVDATNDRGIWSEGSGSLALVARRGDHAPGTPSGVNFSSLSNLNGLSVLNDAGQIAFFASLTDGSIGIWASDRTGVLQLIARTGDPLEVAAGDFRTISYVRFFDSLPNSDRQSKLNNLGQLVFSANFTDGTGGIFVSNRVAVPEPSALALAAAGFALCIVRRRRRAHYTCQNLVRTTDRLRRLSLVLAVGVCVTFFVSAPMAAHAAAVRTVALTGQQAPGTPSGVNYSSLSSAPRLNETGQTAFAANLAGPGVDSSNNGGIWSEGSGSLALVARGGDHAPGTASGVNFGLLSNPTALYESPMLNDVGQTAFFGSAAGSGVGYHGIWATDRTGILQLIAREGDPLEVAPGDLRTISELGFVRFGTGNSDGRPSGFNNLGQLAFSASFTDGSSGVFVSNRVAVPEPSALALAAAGFALCIVRRRRRARQPCQNPVRISDHRRQLSTVLALGVSATFFVAAPMAAHAAAVRTVALSGQPAPGTLSGVNFRTFSRSPVLNDAGQTAFGAFLTGNGVDSTNTVGIWTEGSGRLALVARDGSPAAGTPSGVNYRINPLSLVLNDAGQTAFLARLTGSGVSAANDVGYWSEGSEGLAMVARSGDQAPGTSAGVNFRIDWLSWPVLNNAGQIAFEARLTGSGVDSTNDQGLWSEGSGSLTLVARSGSQAPGTPSGVNFSSGNYNFSPVLNDAGQTAFSATLTGLGVDSTNYNGLWSERSAGLALVARAGDQAPGMPSGVNFDPRLFFLVPELNNAGQTAFYASLSGSGVDSTNNEGLWSEGSGSLTLVARRGDQAPGPPAWINYQYFYSPVLNDAGQIAFNTRSGSYFTFYVEDIYSEGSAGLALVAEKSGYFHSLTLNAAGQIAFSAESGGILATNRTGALQLIAREGDLLEVAPGDFRTIMQLNAVGVGDTGNSDGRPSWFNNLGQLAFWASFTDGSSGIFVSNRVAVPEPSAFALAAAGLGVYIVHRRRRAHQDNRTAVRTNRCAQRLSMVLAVALSTALQQAQPVAHAATVRTVALSGKQAPGSLSGVNYSGFNSPVLNDAGKTAFRGTLTGSGIDATNDVGIWSEGSGSLALVAREGSQAPGTPSGVNYSTIPLPSVLNDVGQIAFTALLSDGGSGVWSEGSGSLALVARTGSQAPGTSSGVTYSSFGLSPPPLLNDAGQTAFFAVLTRSGVVSDINDTGIWSEGSGSLALVAREGDHAPGTASGVNYNEFNSRFVMNDAGQTAFSASLTGSGVDSTNGGGIWSEGSGSLALVARRGDHAPGTPNGVNYLYMFSTPGLNDAGQTAFKFSLAGSGVDATNYRGVWSEGSGSLALVAREGDHAPDTPSGVNFSSLINGEPVLNNAGQTEFKANITGSGVDATNDTGIWSGGSGNLALVAREGDHAPGTPSGVSYGDFNGTSLVLNDAGQIAFLQGSGIWATDRIGAMQLIVRAGDPLEVAPGDIRTISSLSFNFAGIGTSNSNGLPSGFNNLGQLAFVARFTDGTSGIFVSNRVAVPEPSSYSAILVGVLCLSFHVRRTTP